MFFYSVLFSHYVSLTFNGSLWVFSWLCLSTLLFPNALKAEDIDHRSSFVSSIPRFLLYDVNRPEGFNLRRDVYMRLAIFSRSLSDLGDWHLVLPPWEQLYHWQSQISQNHLPWSLFFDLKSLQKFTPVVEMSQFFHEFGNKSVDNIFILQNYKDVWTENFKWEEKWNFEHCLTPHKYFQDSTGLYHGDFWGFNNLTGLHLQCVSFQGQTKLLKNLLSGSNSRSVKIDHAEIALHNHFGNSEYWQCRRSMRFAKHLIKAAESFRILYLNSTNEMDGTIHPEDWTQEKLKRNTLGGPFLCAHLRRKDFLWGRPKLVPSFNHIAEQLYKFRKQFPEIKTIFIATDASHEEYLKLTSKLSDWQVFRYRPTAEDLSNYKDGGVAIIDQIICSHARFFIGTCESTFSFRIQEEREILGFNPETTFNCFCGDEDKNCSQPSKWLIVH